MIEIANIITRAKNYEMAEKINISIQNYNGDESPEWFLEQLCDLKKLNGWSDEIALLFLKSKLTGNARQYFQTSPEFRNVKFDEAIILIKSFFSNDDSPSTNLLTLNNIQLLPGESIKNFGHRINTLVAKTYNSVTDPKALNQIKSLQLINALPLNLKEKLMLEKTDNFKDLIDKAHSISTAQQTILQAEAHNILSSVPVNKDLVHIQNQIDSLNNKINLLQNCSYCNDSHSLAECTKFRDLIKHGGSETVNFARMNNTFKGKRIICFYCKKPGHKQNMCRKFINDQMQSMPQLSSSHNNFRDRNFMPRQNFHNQTSFSNLNPNVSQFNPTQNFIPQNHDNYQPNLNPFGPPQFNQYAPNFNNGETTPKSLN